jgi:hypothetical protein
MTTATTRATDIFGYAYYCGAGLYWSPTHGAIKHHRCNWDWRYYEPSRVFRMTESEARHNEADFIVPKPRKRSRKTPAMTTPILTVEDFLSVTFVGNGYHDFAVEGGTIRLTTERLRAALEAAYDETDPNWVAYVELD